MSPQKLILHSPLCPGDIVMLTGSVRDLHEIRPGEYLTDVRTPCNALFEHNPYITKIAEDDRDAWHIQMEYPLINESGRRPVHFIQGYTDYLKLKLKTDLCPVRQHGDIHLSDEEKGYVSQVHEIIGDNRPFTIINAGSKNDYPLKQWSTARFQQVIDAMPERTWVQVGEAGHNHKPLNGVVNLIGKTDLRQFVRLMYHADAVLTGVSFAMHLAAATPTKTGKPRACVVLAGGRECPTWERYPTHVYLGQIGHMPCCLHDGCWRSTFETTYKPDGKVDKYGCGFPMDDGHGQTIAGCLARYTVDDVVRALRSYE